MATTESIDLNYTLENTTVEEHNVTVRYLLTTTPATISERFIEVYPATTYFAGILSTMTSEELQTQMASNFLACADNTINDFVARAKLDIQKTYGAIGDEGLTGVVTYSEIAVITLSDKPYTFTVTWN
jgi:hypothetical protein